MCVFVYCDTDKSMLSHNWNSWSWISKVSECFCLFLNTEARCSVVPRQGQVQCCFVHRDRMDYLDRAAQDGHLNIHTARERWSKTQISEPTDKLTKSFQAYATCHCSNQLTRELLAQPGRMLSDTDYTQNCPCTILTPSQGQRTAWKASTSCSLFLTPVSCEQANSGVRRPGTLILFWGGERVRVWPGNGVPFSFNRLRTGLCSWRAPLAWRMHANSGDQRARW